MTATPDAPVDYATVETATLGHFLSDGFMVPAIQSVSSGIRIAGPALTVRLPGDDGMALVEALSIAEPGQIVVVDRCGDLRHACWGAVTTNAAIARGVKGAIIDGFITDLSAIRELGFPADVAVKLLEAAKKYLVTQRAALHDAVGRGEWVGGAISRRSPRSAHSPRAPPSHPRLCRPLTSP